MRQLFLCVKICIGNKRKISLISSAVVVPITVIMVIVILIAAVKILVISAKIPSALRAVKPLVPVIPSGKLLPVKMIAVIVVS